jgi:hypothetical protein
MKAYSKKEKGIEGGFKKGGPMKHMKNKKCLDCGTPVEGLYCWKCHLIRQKAFLGRAIRNRKPSQLKYE